MKQLKKESFAYMCRKVDNTNNFKFKVGDLYCDTVTGKAFSCLNPLLTDFVKMDPSTNEGRSLLQFTSAWKEVAASDLTDKIFIQKYAKHNNEPKRCNDWNYVTDAKFSGTYFF